MSVEKSDDMGLFSRNKKAKQTVIDFEYGVTQNKKYVIEIYDDNTPQKKYCISRMPGSNEISAPTIMQVMIWVRSVDPDIYRCLVLTSDSQSFEENIRINNQGDNETRLDALFNQLENIYAERKAWERQEAPTENKRHR